MLNSFFDLTLEVFKKGENSRNAKGSDKSSVNLGPIALFINFKLTTSSGKHLEDINHAQKVSLKYKLITNAKDSDDLSFGFDRDRSKRQQELTDNKNKKRKDHNRIKLKDIFGFAELQHKSTYGLGYKLTLT